MAVAAQAAAGEDNAAPANKPLMADPRIIDIELDERTILLPQRRYRAGAQIAIFDLLEKQSSSPSPAMTGPIRILLRVEEAGSRSTCSTRTAQPLETIRIGLARFRRPIRDYFAICDSYFQAVRADGAKGIEPIDMARRAPPQRGGRAAPGMPRTARSRWISTPPAACSP